jgi:hypothetical protein
MVWVCVCVKGLRCFEYALDSTSGEDLHKVIHLTYTYHDVHCVCHVRE